MKDKILLSVISIVVTIISIALKNLRPFKKINKTLDKINKDILTLNDDNKKEHNKIFNYINRVEAKEEALIRFEKKFADRLNNMLNEYDLENEKLKDFARQKAFNFMNFSQRLLRKENHTDIKAIDTILNSALTSIETTRLKGEDILGKEFINYFYDSHQKMSIFFMQRIEDIIFDKRNDKQERLFTLCLFFFEDFLSRIPDFYEEWSLIKNEEVFCDAVTMSEDEKEDSFIKRLAKKSKTANFTKIMRGVDELQ